MTSSPKSFGEATLLAQWRVLERTLPRPSFRRILLFSGVVSSVWYVATDIIGTLRYPGYSWLDQEFSELTAKG
jgi:hypothetical protein